RREDMRAVEPHFGKRRESFKAQILPNRGQTTIFRGAENGGLSPIHLVPPVVGVVVAGKVDVRVDRSGDRAGNDGVVPFGGMSGELAGFLQRAGSGTREPPALMQPEGGVASDDAAGREGRHGSCE